MAPEDASVIIDDLKELEIPETGSISVEHIDTQLSDAAEGHAEDLASDAVIWEDVEAGSGELTELSLTFVAYMVLGLNLVAIVLAGVGTLYLQRRMYLSRRHSHLSDPIRWTAGLPVGRSRRSLGGGGASAEARSRGES